MVFVQFPPDHGRSLQASLRERGILLQAAHVTRLVTHLDVTETDIDAVVGAVKQYFARVK
jgi:threonine aldolase